MAEAPHRVSSSYFDLLSRLRDDPASSGDSSAPQAPDMAWHLAGEAQVPRAMRPIPEAPLPANGLALPQPSSSQ